MHEPNAVASRWGGGTRPVSHQTKPNQTKVLSTTDVLLGAAGRHCFYRYHATRRVDEIDDIADVIGVFLVPFDCDEVCL